MQKIVEEKYGGKINIILAENVDQVLTLGMDHHRSIDYVAIVCDTTIWKVSDQVSLKYK